MFKKDKLKVFIDLRMFFFKCKPMLIRSAVSLINFIIISFV